MKQENPKADRFEIELSRLKSCYEEDWYPPRIPGGERELWRFRLLPASEGDMIARAQELDKAQAEIRAEDEKLETSNLKLEAKSNQGRWELMAKADKNFLIWQVRRFARPPEWLEKVWNSEKILDLPFLGSLTAAINKKIFSSDRLLPPEASAEAEVAAGKS